MARPEIMRRLIESEWTLKYAALMEKFPLIESDSDIWLRFVKSTVPDPIPVYKSFQRGFGNLSTLSTYLDDEEESISQHLTSWLDNSSASLLRVVDAVSGLRKSWGAIASNSERSKLRKEIIQQARNFEREWLVREHKNLHSELPEVYESYKLCCEVTHSMPQIPSAEITAKLPSIANRTLVFRSYREVVSDPSSRTRKREKHTSDPADIMHAQYLPYCDIFRCDSFASTYLAGAASKSDTTLVNTHSQLINVIESELRQRTKYQCNAP
jgi:hypothetical protein